MFSKTCEYAIKVIVYLAYRDYNETSWAGVKEIAEAIASPPSFTSKVLQQLTKNKLLRSMRGPNGGFAKVEGRDIRLAEVVQAIDGQGVMENCILGFEHCTSEYPCPLHDKFQTIRVHLNSMLTDTTVEEMRKMLDDNECFLKE